MILQGTAAITGLRVAVALTALGSVSSQAGTIIYEPDNYTSNVVFSGLNTTNYFSGVTLNERYLDTTPYYGTKISSSYGDRYFAPEHGSNWLKNFIFRGSFSSTTSMVSLDVWGSSAMFAQTGVLNAYSSGGTRLGSSSTTGAMYYDSPKQTLTVQASNIGYFELVGTGDGGLRTDHLTFYGTPTYNPGQHFVGYQDTSSGAGTTAELIGGTASGTRTIATSFSPGSSSGTVTLAGDVLDLTGMGGDTFVLQMDYLDQTLADLSLNETDLRLLWKDGSGNFVNSVWGNSNAGFVGDSLFVEGAYDSATHILGNYGVDADNNTVWAVLDHNSEFGVGSIPEPATTGLVLFGVAGLLSSRKRRS